MAKLDFPICLIDESVVDYGFRVLMSGAQLDQFKRNPVLLLQHERIGGSGLLKGQQLTESAVLPLGKWCDFEIKGGQLLAVPEFDDDDEFALKVEGKVKKGYLNGASIWIEPLEVSDDAALKLVGQTGPTITKWGIREASIVDIPNCRNALAIRTPQGKISLSGSLPDDGVLDYLKTFLSKTDALKGSQIKDSKPSNVSDNLNLELSDLMKMTGAELWEKGLFEKLKEMDKESFFIKYKEAFGVDHPDAAKMNADTTELTSLLKMSGDELYEKGLFERLKKLSLPTFTKKYKDFFGCEFPTCETDKANGKENLLSLGTVENLELKWLLTMSGDELYENGLFEKLKAISLPHFKTKFKDCFGCEFSES